MDLIEKIKLKERSLGGSIKAPSEAKLLFEEEKVSMNGKGLHVNPLSGPLHPGKIHTFKYDPLTADTLSFYDKNPLMIALGSIKGSNGRLEVGINLNFIPPKFKYYFLDLLWKTYSSKIESSMGKGDIIPIKQNFVHYDYQLLKKILTKYGFGFAIRTYYPSRMSKPYVTCFEYWDVLALLNIKDLEGINEGQMNKLFNEYIINNK